MKGEYVDVDGNMLMKMLRMLQIYFESSGTSQESVALTFENRNDTLIIDILCWDPLDFELRCFIRP